MRPEQIDDVDITKYRRRDGASPAAST